MRDRPQPMRSAAPILAAVPPAPALVSVQGLRFVSRAGAHLDGIDLTIAEGRRTVILGPNGAGKSLLLRILHGLLKPSEGAVLWRGRPLDRAGRLAQAMVFQRPVLLRRSVRANLTFALAVRGVPRRARGERVDRALARARLSHLADGPARVLSGGEQQRLALARALLAEPEILFLDEPTASLDPASTDAVERLVGDAHRAGVTVVLVTHDRGQARRLGDDLLFFDRGRLVERGPARATLDAPRSQAMRAWTDGRLYFHDTSPATETR